jgi:hypothetical protein
LEGVDEADATHRFEPMNCISWMVGHLANQENYYWVRLAQGKKMVPELREIVGYGLPATTPPLKDMWDAWRTVTDAADGYLETLNPGVLTNHFELRGKEISENIGTLLMRNIFHYWYHIGEASSIRQLLGHPDVPEFVGNMSTAFYSSEGA